MAVVVYHELDTADIASAAATTPATPDPPPLVSPNPQPASFTLPPIETFAGVTERPLFSPTRQAPPLQTQEETLGPLTSFVLTGVIISESGRTALIRHGQPPAIARVKEGQVIEGWTVQSVQPGGVTLQHAGAQTDLKLREQSTRPVPGRQTR